MDYVISYIILFIYYLIFLGCQLQEQNTIPSLRKALKDVAMEKDAAVVARVCTILILVVLVSFEIYTYRLHTHTYTSISFYCLLMNSDILV